MISFLSFLSKSSQLAKGGGKALIASLLISVNAMAQNPLQVQIVPHFYAGGYNISCFGGSNGKISTQVTGGIAPYSFNWNHGPTSQNLQNLTAGNYVVTVTDAQNQTVTAQIELYQPHNLLVIPKKSSYHGFNISSQGASDGQIELFFRGGNAPYQVTWGNGLSGPFLTNLNAGNYSYTVNDVGGCTKTGTINMNQPGPLSASTQIINHISCNGLSDGVATVWASGGQPPYRIQWDNGQFSDTVSDLSQGRHGVIVFDANNAQIQNTFFINNPQELQLQLTPTVYPNGKNTSCHDCCNATVVAQATGGTSPYTYQWLEAGQTTATLSNVCEGFYTLRGSDYNGCTTTSQVFLSAPKANNWNLTGNTNSDPNTQFIGTTDQKDLVFKTNNTETFRLGADGKARFGQSPIINNLADANLGALKLNIPFTTASGEFTVPSEWKIEYQPLGLRPCKKPINIAAWQFAATGEGENDYDPEKINYFGKVGINVCFPNQELHVNGTGLINGNLIATGSTIIGSENTGNQWTNNEPTLYINNSGASSALHINALGKTDYSFIQHIKTDNAKAKVFNVDLNDQSKFTIYGNGNVVIGDQTAGSADNSSKLMVDGLIAAREVRVRMTAFPDYVFKEDYKRLTKEEIKAYIDKNGHLPFFPSEKEIVENGLSLGEFQQKMVEAIENLYLIILND